MCRHRQSSVPVRRTIDFGIEEWREFTGVVHIECTDFLQAAVVEHERTPGIELLAASVEIGLQTRGRGQSALCCPSRERLRKERGKVVVPRQFGDLARSHRSCV